MGLGDGGDVLGPLFPVGALADLVHEAGVDGLPPVADLEQHLLDVVGGLGLLVGEALGVLPGVGGGAVLVADRLVAGADVPDADVLRSLAVQPDLVDGGVEPVVVSPQGLEHLPDGLEPLVVGKGLRGRHARGHGDRQDDVAVGLAVGSAHDAADGLHHVHDRVARVQEQDRVQAGYVHALGQAARVGQDAGAGGAGVLLEPVQELVAAQRVERAVDVVDLAAEHVLVRVVVGVDDGVEVGGDGPGVRDGPGKGDGALHRRRVVAEAGAVGEGARALGQGVPAADDLRRVIQVELGLPARQSRLQRPGDDALVDDEDQDLVVGEQALLDGLAEPEAVELRPVQLLVVHRGDGRVLVLRLLLGLIAVDARRRGHVQPAVPAEVAVVVHADERRLIRPGQDDAGRPMRLVADNQVEPPEALLLGRRDGVNRLVRGQHDRHARADIDAAHLGDEPRWARRGGQREVVRGQIPVVALGPLLADLRVGADREGPHRDGRLMGPFPQRLRQQRDRRDQEQDTGPLPLISLRALPLEPLGDLQAREGLARAAGHDEPDPVMVREAREHRVECLGLVQAGPLLRVQAQLDLDGHIAGGGDAPVDRAGRDVG